jgi:hypothetical protein
MWMDQPKFRDWKKYLHAQYEKPARWVNTDGDKVPFMKVRWFKYGVGEGPDGALVSHPDEVWYRLSLDAKEPWKIVPLTRIASAVTAVSDPVYTLHHAALELDPKKVKDLAKFKAWLPKEFHSLYPDPPRPAARGVSEAAAGDDESEDASDSQEELESTGEEASSLED